MYDFDRNFRVAVDANIECTTKILLEIIDSKDLIKISEIIFTDENNIFEVKPNEDFDKTLVEYEENGYMFYQTNIDVYCKNLKENIEKQVIISKEIRNAFIKRKILAEIIADFEPLL